MITVLLAALRSIFLKLFAVMATEAMLKWMLFWVTDLIVKSTKTTKDDEFYKKIREEYDKQN